MYCRVKRLSTDGSEMCTASIIRDQKTILNIILADVADNKCLETRYKNCFECYVINLEPGRKFLRKNCLAQCVEN
jgi:hypothetical protein